MTLGIIGWRNGTGYDVHLLRGTTAAALLGDVLVGERVSETKIDWYRADGAKAKAELEPIKFRLLLDPAAATDAGVTLDVDTGAVTAAAVTGAAIPNFLVHVNIMRKGTTDVLDSTNIRVHVHDEVKSMWLTPSPLTVYRGSPGQRFTVLAELASTGQPGAPLVCDISRLPNITWSSVSDGVTVAATGEISATKLGPLKVTAKLPGAWGGKQADGDAIAVLGWHEQPSEARRANLVYGPGFDRLAEVPNILLLAEGFTKEQRSDWDDLVRALVDDLASSWSVTPFDLFLTNDSLNVWSLFLESREPGSSALYEVRAVASGSGSSLVAEAIPRSRFTRTVMDIHDVLARFGEPVRGDWPPSDTTARKDAYKAKISAWNKLRGAAIDPDVPGMFELWETWASWAMRTLLDERDTALGLAFGVRPNVSADSIDRAAVYHPFRTNRAELDKLLAKVSDGDGPSIGHVWVKGASTRPEAGKDASLVIAVIAGGRSGGVESDRNIASASIHDADRVPVERHVDDDSSWRLKPQPLDMPRSIMRGIVRVPARQRGTIVHELAHSFGLGDEYVEDELHDLSIPVTKEPFTKLAGNIMLTKEALGGASAPGDKLVGDKLRWLWPRIAKAGVLTAKPWSSGTNRWVLELRRGHKHRFANGDVVFLRQRPLRGSVDGKLVLAKVSKPLEVTSDMQDGDQIVVEVQDGSALVPDDWPAMPGRESIVYLPVPAPAYAQARHEKDALLVPLVVRDFITQRGLPLNRSEAGKCNALGGKAAGNSDPRAVVHEPSDTDRFLVDEEWVGAFDGGARWACGVLHPAPHCMMRGVSTTATFCAVCRYLLVDMVDPSLHGDIDKEYARRYVEPIP